MPRGIVSRLSALVQYRLIRARRWPPCGWVRRAPRRGLVGVRRLRDALRRITGHGVRMPAPGPPSATSLIVLPPIASNRCAFSFWLAVGEGCRPRRRAVSLAVRLSWVSWLSQKEFLKIGGRRGRWATARSCPRAAPGMFCSGRGGQGRNPEGAVPRLALGAAALSMPGTGHRARAS